MIESALSYHRMGIGVIPLKPRDKRPLIEWETYQKSRPTEEKIRAWWTMWPDANIGVITGAVSGVVVLDADGAESEESLKGKHLPITPSSTTAKGTHYWFTHPGKPIACWTRKLPGIDLRGDGGYVAAPPSVHPTGAIYEWAIPLGDKTELADMPLWLLKICGQRPVLHIPDGEEEPEEWFDKAIMGVGSGERNDITARLAGRYLSLGLSPRETINMMLAWNTKNKPPLPEQELVRTIRSIHKREWSKRASEAMVAGEEMNLAKLPEMEQREIILMALQEALAGVKIHRVIKYMADRPSYMLETTAGSINLGDVTNLIQQFKFRTRVAELENKYLKAFKPRVWDVIAEKLLAIAEEIEVSAEATIPGQTRWWVRTYLDTVKPSENPDMATNGRKPFLREGITYLSLPGLLRFISQSMLERGVTSRELAVRLRGIGAENKLVRIGEKVIKLWELPPTEP